MLLDDDVEEESEGDDVSAEEEEAGDGADVFVETESSFDRDE